MTPKDKCNELIDKFSNRWITNVRAMFIVAVEHSILLVDEILKNSEVIYPNYNSPRFNDIFCDEWYWQEVKNELLKLQNNE